MKTIFQLLSCILVLIIGSAQQGYAQKITYKKSTIHVDGEPWATMTRKGNPVTGRSYMLLAANDSLIASAEEVKGRKHIWFEVEFPTISKNTKFKVEGSKPAQLLAKAFVQSGVLDSGVLSVQGVDTFCTQYGSIDFYSSKALNPEDFKLVVRDTAANIFVGINDVKQDGKLVGHYFERKGLYQGEHVTQVIFKLPSGLRVGVIRLVGTDATSGTINTFTDNQKHDISFDTPGAYLKAIAAFLVKNGYL